MPDVNVFVSGHNVNLDITVITLTIPEHVVCVRFVLIAYSVKYKYSYKYSSPSCLQYLNMPLVFRSTRRRTILVSVDLYSCKKKVIKIYRVNKVSNFKYFKTLNKKGNIVKLTSTSMPG